MGVESVNRPGDHVAARRLLDKEKTTPSADEVAHADFDMKAFARVALAR